MLGDSNEASVILTEKTETLPDSNIFPPGVLKVICLVYVPLLVLTTTSRVLPDISTGAQANQISDVEEVLSVIVLDGEFAVSCGSFVGS